MGGLFEPGPPVTLKKIAITGGPAQLLGSFDGASRGATWGDDGSIVMATAAPSTGLYRVSSTGGEPTVLTRPNRERGEYDHLYPQYLPGNQTVLFTITASPGTLETALVAALDLETGDQKILVRGGSQAFYVSSGHLVYVAAGALRAVRFDVKRLEVVGTAVPVVSELVMLPTGAADFDLTRDGTLAYVVGGTSQETAPLYAGLGRPHGAGGDGARGGTSYPAGRPSAGTFPTGRASSSRRPAAQQAWI